TPVPPAPTTPSLAGCLYLFCEFKPSPPAPLPSSGRRANMPSLSHQLSSPLHLPRLIACTYSESSNPLPQPLSPVGRGEQTCLPSPISSIDHSAEERVFNSAPQFLDTSHILKYQPLFPSPSWGEG